MDSKDVPPEFDNVSSFFLHAFKLSGNVFVGESVLQRQRGGGGGGEGAR